MSTERISDAEEQRLVGAVRQAISETNRGVDPDSAIAKVAEAQRYGPEFIGRMVEMYNTSRTLAHLKQAAGPERAADFPIATTDKVVERMVPAATLQQDLPNMSIKVASQMLRIRADIPTLEKAAGYMPDGAAKIDKILSKEAELKSESRRLKTEISALRDRRDTALGKAATYFRQIPHAPFEEVESAVRSMFGKAGALAAECLWDQLGSLQTREKRAVAADSYPHIADVKVHPYSYLCEFVEKSREMAKLASLKASVDEELTESSKLIKDRLGRIEKLSFDLGTAALVGTITRNPAIGAMAMDKQPGAVLDASIDPEHENKVRGIKMESTLQDFIANDPVISKYDPQDVIDSYNEISQMAPIASTQPAVVRGYLRRLLESGPNVKGRVMEGFEAGQLADIENKMRPAGDVIGGLLRSAGSQAPA